MCESVGLHIVNEAKGLAANITGVWLLTGMDHQVVPQVGPAVEGLATVVTLKALLA